VSESSVEESGLDYKSGMKYVVSQVKICPLSMGSIVACCHLSLPSFRTRLERKGSMMIDSDRWQE
jgi:hypothetical protein